MSTPPIGIGMFIWMPQYCEGGDWDRIIAKAHTAGLKWLILHNFWSAESVQKLKQAGFYVAYSFFSSPGANIPQECTDAAAAVAAGCDAILFDAETAWETNAAGQVEWRGTEATAFINQLRAAVPNTFLANAGAWNWPIYHRAYPDREFAANCDGAMPERYWTEFPTTQPYAGVIKESEKEWSTYPDVMAYKSVIPIGSGYGTNGPVPGGHQPLNAADFKDFATRYPTCAFWSWMHMPADCWAVLQALASTPSV